jgi:hypothetical protein
MKKYKAKMRFKAVAKAIMATKRMQNAFKVRPKVATQSDSAIPIDRTQVSLGYYICIFFYFHVDSLTYAFGWSAFLCRIRFCDTLVVIFLN